MVPDLVARAGQISAPDADVAVPLEVTAVVFIAGNFLELRPVFVESFDRSVAVRLGIDVVEGLAGDEHTYGLCVVAHGEKNALVGIVEGGPTRR